MDFELDNKERAAALASLDKRRIDAYCKRHGMVLPKDDYVYWLSVHKAITGDMLIGRAIRLKSAKWLIERGSRHFMSDMTSEERIRIEGTEND